VQREVEDDLGVGTAAGARPTLAAEPPSATTEKDVEDVSEVAAEAERLAAATAATGTGASYPLRPEHVVAAAALGIPEGFVGEGDLFEALLGGGVASRGIRVKLARQGPIGLLQLVFVGAPADAEELVIISGHVRNVPDRGCDIVA
jgi:hypothetical protein